MRSLLAARGIVIGLHPTSDANLKGNSGNVSIGFTADDFKATRILLQQIPIAITERQEDGRQFLRFNDPDGTALYFIKLKW